jgi:hypothetical protein
LSFTSLKEIMPEVDRLVDKGHTTVGKWSLAQICNHLSTTIIWSVDGYPMVLPWIVRATVGKLGKAHLLRTKKMMEGLKLPRKLVPSPDLDLRAEVESLRAAINLYLSNDKEPATHAIMGRLTKAEAEQIHLIHAAHHLSFVIPNA